MSRFSRINTIWRKELIDTLRDKRTVVAMVLVPMVLYPALMLGSLQALEVQVGSMVTERYDIAVADEAAQRWLRRLIDSDPARQPPNVNQSAEQAVEREKAVGPGQTPASSPARRSGGAQAARVGVREHPPELRVLVIPDIQQAVLAGLVHAGVMLKGPPPAPDQRGSTPVAVLYDESDIRSSIAAGAVAGVLERASQQMLVRRLHDFGVGLSFVQPLALEESNIAPEERMTGSVLGQIVPLILILMTMTGAIYPAIDLTAGERERGTLETLMVAPVPTMDLIAGKFIVVTLIGLLSATLNLLSVGGTIYLGGVGAILTRGASFTLPLQALPWIMLLLVPLAVLFSAALLAVCSFARSFKEAQNYIVPVMMAALIPGVVGILPGTRLEGPIMIMPVANIVVLARELFMGKFDAAAIAWVTLSTSLYAGAAVAIAAKLFGQEAVLFSDAGSVKTLFQRRHFKPSRYPSAASALLVLTLVFSLNYYIQNGIHRAGLMPGVPFLAAIALTLVLLLGLGPWIAARYVRVEPYTAFALRPAPPIAFGAALLFGVSTWVLVQKWVALQGAWLPMDQNMRDALEELSANILGAPLPFLLLFLALVPALVEEFFFRGYVLSGLRTTLSPAVAVLIVALAFGLYHGSAHRFVQTTALGLALGLMAVRFGSIWPGVVAHMMHNAISLASQLPQGLQPLLQKAGYMLDERGGPPQAWVIGAAAVTVLGLVLTLSARPRPLDLPQSARALAG